MFMNLQAIKDRVTYEVPLEHAQRRLRELIVYISGKTAADVHFGTVKLNKTLFRSDFRSFRNYGTPITGMRYQKLERGPAPVGVKPVQLEMASRGEIVIKQEEVFGLPQHRVVPLRRPDLTIFSGRDIAVVDEIIHELWGKTGTQVSNESHGIQWMTRVLRDRIPYEAAYLSDEPITPSDVERTAALAAKFGWVAA